METLNIPFLNTGSPDMASSPDAALLLTFVLLLLAHLLGDFVLQPTSWARQKSKQGYKSPVFWYHIILHGLLAFLLIARLDFWPYALLLTLLHGAIDQLKSEKERTLLLPAAHAHPARSIRRWFWYDQCFHLVSIILISILWQVTATPEGTWAKTLDSLHLLLQQIWTPGHIVLFTLIIFLTRPAAIIIRQLITGWTPSYNTALETDSLKNAGTYIGILERLFVFIFIINGHMEAVGFLLAAKSIFRFGDLKAAKDRKLTEYVLIGTLISFGLAILAAIIYLQGNLP
ncbi:Protein of unknown function [Arachidicoccus rhizosphaerae]|uniref:DUF3307 domain-containing protein n=1 Tax=Arachidicoccus rhizosphaerae TaxID=551991 RepID=A0A1H4AYT6_9BACT|nr:DUF3307 domain-containing protein [Arachidicoccus rhizosphaerae]SEA41061.1 Protein of unknown function [Arachidicoccus rhizosphaerae]